MKKLFDDDKTVIGLIVFFVASIMVYFATLNIDPHHDGFMFKTALDVAHGKVMYRDTYSQYGILTFAIQALFIQFFGEKILSIRIATIFMYVIAFVVNYLIWEKFFHRYIALAMTCVILFMAPFYSWIFLPWSSVYALSFLLLSAYSYVLYMENLKIGIVLCAIFSFASFLCRQPVGIVLVVAFYLAHCIFFFVSRRQKEEILYAVKMYTTTMLLSILAFLIYLTLSGSLSDFWIQNIRYMISWGTVASHGIDQVSWAHRIYKMISFLGDCLIIEPLRKREIAWTVLALLSLASLIREIIVCKKKGVLEPKDASIIMLSMYACASWHQYFPVPCIRHLYWGSFPMFGVALYFLMVSVKGIWSEMENKKLYAVIMVIFLVICSGVIFRRTRAIYHRSQLNYAQLENSEYHYLDGLKLSRDEQIFFSSMHHKIYSEKQWTGKHVMNYTPHGYFALFDEENYFKEWNNWEGHWGHHSVYKNYLEIANEYIKNQQPIIIAESGMQIDNYHVAYVSQGSAIYSNTGEISIYIPNTPSIRPESED